MKRGATAAKGVGEVSEEGFKLLGSGEADVTGSETAQKLDFKRVMNLKADGKDHPVEQHMVFFRLPSGHIVTMRFITPEGTYDHSGLPAVRDSVQVNES